MWRKGLRAALRRQVVGCASPIWDAEGVIGRELAGDAGLWCWQASLLCVYHWILQHNMQCGTTSLVSQVGQDRSLALPHTARSSHGHALLAYAVEYLGHSVAEVAGQLPPFICGAET